MRFHIVRVELERPSWGCTGGRGKRRGELQGDFEVDQVVGGLAARRKALILPSVHPEGSGKERATFQAENCNTLDKAGFCRH